MKPILVLTSLTLVVLICPGPAQGQAAVEVWVNHYNGLGNAGDHPTAVAVDAAGNVYVTGHSTGSDGNYDYTTIKYSGAGVPGWTNHYGGQAFNSDSANDVAVDVSGNVFVTGASFDSTTSYDYATIKYSGAGVPVWTNRYRGPLIGPDVAVALALDTNGNAFVTGYASAPGNGSDFATIKYSGAGVPLWTNRYNGPGNGTDGASALALDSSGDVIVTGVAGGNGTLADYATIKYSNAGMPLWTNLFNGSGNQDDMANALAVDANGNVFVTGYQSGSGSGFDYATIKYSGAGVPLWTNLYGGIVNGTDVANAIALDPGGNVLVTGYSGNGFTTDYATIKYSNAGVPLWTNRYNGPGNTMDQATAIKVDSSSNVFVTGYSINSSNYYRYATIAYSGAGQLLWTNLYDGAGNNALFTNPSLAVDQNGNVCVAGYSTGPGSSQDYTVIKYSASSPWLTVTRTPTNTVAISWPAPATGFVLQQNTNGLSSPIWSDAPALPADDGLTKTAVIQPTLGDQYFRLRK